MLVNPVFLSYNRSVDMLSKIKNKFKRVLIWSQKYTEADMFYVTSTGFWTTFGFGITSIFSLTLIITFANFLPKETYGIYKYVMSLSGALAFLTFSGMNTAVTQAVANGHDGILNYALKFQLKWNVLFLVVSSSIGVYYFIHNNYVLAVSLLILGIAFPLISAFNTYGAFLAGKKDFKRSNLWSMFLGGIYSLAMILAIVVMKNVVVLVLVYALANLIPTMCFYYWTVKVYKPPRHDHDEEKGLLNYSAHLSFINIFSNLSQYVDKIVVFHFLGAVELAIYGLALAVPERIRGYSKSYGSIILPKLASKTMSDIRPVFYKRLFQCVLLGILISLGYIIAAPLAFKIFLPKYLESIKYSQIISLSFIITIPATYMAGVFYSQKMLKTIYLSSTVAHISRIVLFVIFGYMWGVWGVIYASLLVYLLGFFYNILLWELEVKKHKRSVILGDINKETLSEEARPQIIE